MTAIFAGYDRLVRLISGSAMQSLTLLFTRIVPAGIFWRSARTKIEQGSWLTISDTTYFLFSEEHAGVPLPSDLAAALATVSEHVFPIHPSPEIFDDLRIDEGEKFPVAIRLMVIIGTSAALWALIGVGIWVAMR